MYETRIFANRYKYNKYNINESIIFVDRINKSRININNNTLIIRLRSKYYFVNIIFIIVNIVYYFRDVI